MLLAKFILPFPPSVNQLYPTVGRRRIKSKKYEDWIRAASIAFNKQAIPAITERCIAVYSLNHPDNRHRDAENYAKAITDFLVNRGVLQDDCRRYLKGTYAHWNDEEGEAVEIMLVKPDILVSHVL